MLVTRKLLHTSFFMAAIFILVLTWQQNMSKFCEKDSGNLFGKAENPYTLSEEELQFPLAFSMLVYKEPERVIRLLNAIYRPHNSYCIHVDRKADDNIFLAIQYKLQLLGKNVYLIPKVESISVKWGHTTVLDPEIMCGRYLLKMCKKWKYFINLTGQEYPLRTNLELVLALKAINGSNVVDTNYKWNKMYRFPQVNPFGVNFKWYKGSVHIAVRREFVDYMVNHHKAHELYRVLNVHQENSTIPVVPDETFFATLNNNPQVFSIPGAYTGKQKKYHTGGLIRTKVWLDSNNSCGTNIWVRKLCIFGLRDLPKLLTQPTFFANKFHTDVEPTAYDALEAWIEYKVRYETRHGRPHSTFNLHYYETHPLSSHHL